MSENPPPPADLRAWCWLLGAFALLMVAYFTLPLGWFGDRRPLLSWSAFVGALVALSWLMLAKIVGVLRGTAKRPVVWLVFLIALAMTIFAATYYALGAHKPEFAGLETRLDALYFTVVTMATVGYGDITPTGQAARLVVVLQIGYNFVFLAAAAGTASQAVRSTVAQRVRHRD
ncbi:potassium channel family protein [Kitasatospora sp. Ki12]|uniref:potassium channel family protein n=1 Tax=Kitasatospora xanthocidica TaxID=83382 RepID=UPI001679E1D7|nr:two pore domain potassium channel family protein [Kitasatospora xanthocidica]GHF26937.1 membrane protein [Kitasatospora xanthocidica]